MWVPYCPYEARNLQKYKLIDHDFYCDISHEHVSKRKLIGGKTLRVERLFSLSARCNILHPLILLMEHSRLSYLSKKRSTVNYNSLCRHQLWAGFGRFQPTKCSQKNANFYLGAIIASSNRCL